MIFNFIMFIEIYYNIVNKNFLVGFSSINIVLIYFYNLIDIKLLLNIVGKIV